MARKVDKIPPGPGPGVKPSYPWDQWLNGDLWELVRGEDFTSAPNTVVMAAQNYGGRHNILVEACQRGGKVYVQAIGVNGE